MSKNTLNFNDLARKRDAIQNAIVSFEQAFLAHDLNELSAMEEEVLREEVRKVKRLSGEIEFDELEDLGEIELTAKTPSSAAEYRGSLHGESFSCRNETLFDDANVYTKLYSSCNQASSFVNEDTMKQARDCSMKAEKKLEEVYTNLDRKMDRLCNKLDKIMLIMKSSPPASKQKLSRQNSECSSSSNESIEKPNYDETELEDENAYELDEYSNNVESFLARHSLDVESKGLSNSEKLRRLYNHCKGLAYDSIKYCHILGDDGYLYALDILRNKFNKEPRYVQHSRKVLSAIEPIKYVDTQSLFQLKTSLLKIESFHIAANQQDMLDSDAVIEEVVEKMNNSLHSKWDLYIAWKNERNEEVVFKSLIEFINNELKNLKQRLQVNCKFCTSEEHEINTCTKFRRLSEAKQIKFMQSHQTCNICYEQGHDGENCNKGIIPNFQIYPENWEEYEFVDSDVIDKSDNED